MTDPSDTIIDFLNGHAWTFESLRKGIYLQIESNEPIFFKDVEDIFPIYGLVFKPHFNYMSYWMTPGEEHVRESIFDK